MKKKVLLGLCLVTTVLFVGSQAVTPTATAMSKEEAIRKCAACAKEAAQGCVDQVNKRFPSS